MHIKLLKLSNIFPCCEADVVSIKFKNGNINNPIHSPAPGLHYWPLLVWRFILCRVYTMFHRYVVTSLLRCDVSIRYVHNNLLTTAFCQYFFKLCFYDLIKIPIRAWILKLLHLTLQKSNIIISSFGAVGKVAMHCMSSRQYWSKNWHLRIKKFWLMLRAQSSSRFT